MTLNFDTSIAAPAPIGTPVTWTAGVTNADPGVIWYRFRIRNPESAHFRMVRDFSPANTLEWVPAERDGVYQLEITARNRDTGASVVTTTSFEIAPLAMEEPVITPTGNELVFLYSAPPCPENGRMRVQFESPEGFRQSTSAMNCGPGRSMNTYLAGMRPETEYKVKHIVTFPDGLTLEGPEMRLTTGELRWAPKPSRSLQKPSGTIRQGTLLQSKVLEYTTATDMDGNMTWYCPADIRYLTRPEPGGYFMAIIERTGGDDSEQMVRLVDLACNTVFETNAARINEQLEAMGKRHITSFHHEARRLPSGKFLVLAANEQILTDVQGPGDVDVIGDVILVLDRDLQVEWVWDAFDHLDPRRAAILGETCLPGGGGCPEFRLRSVANDWLHGNSLQLAPDGNILYSARHQDWIIKIDYANGNGSGDVIWKLGKDGDFTMQSEDASPWFSHQHDANYETGEAQDRMLVFDNGNTRHADDSSAHSRGQLLQLDEPGRTAKLVLNADLGTYSLALGSAQKLNDGNYHFNLGWAPNGFSQALEYDADGKLITAVETETPQYRSFRMRDLYRP